MTAQRISASHTSLSRQKPHQDYLPVRRIAKACDNCRKKKTRCTGEHPQCSNCQRQFQECKYTSPSAPSFKPGLACQDRENDNQIWKRINHLEQSIGRIEGKIERLLSMYEIFNRSSNVPRTTENLSSFFFPELQPEQYSLSAIYPSDLDMLPFLPSGEDQSTLVDIYFTYCQNQPYSLIHEGDFRHRFREGHLESHLLLAVIANANKFAVNSSIGSKYQGMEIMYADSAWKAIVADCFLETGNVDLVTIQTLTLLAIFDFTAGKVSHGSAWLKIGIAVRLAQDLRLMEEPDDTISLGEREERRRVFWSLYLLERFVSCSRGRPPAIMDSSCFLQLPADERAWVSKVEQETSTLTHARKRLFFNNRKLSSFGRLITSASLLSRCTHYMVQNESLIRDEPWQPQSRHAGLLSELILFESELQLDQPLEVAVMELSHTANLLKRHTTCQLILSRLLFHLCQCLVFHPFLLRERTALIWYEVPEAFWSHAKTACRKASEDIIDLFHRANETGCMLSISFCGYCLTVAATIQALHTLADIKDGISSSLFMFQQCLVDLEAQGKYWNSAMIMSAKLKEFMENVNDYGLLMVADYLGSSLDDHKREFLWSILDYNAIARLSLEELQR